MPKSPDQAKQNGANRSRPQIAIAHRRTPKRAEIIAHQLVDYIVNADLAPGTSLPPEHEMIELVGAGRTTVREALRLLETRGVLTIKAGPGGGPVVRRPRPADLGEALTLILQFEGAPVSEMFEARIWLEAAVARLACGKIKPAQAEQLRKINQVIADNLDDQEIALAQNREFHRTIGEIAGNVVLRIFLETLVAVADGSAVGIQYGRRQIEAIVVGHEQIVDSLESGDPARAGKTVKDHFEESQRYWRRYFKSNMTQPVHWIQ